MLPGRPHRGTLSSCSDADPRDERGRLPPRAGTSGSQGRCRRSASRCATADPEQCRLPEWRGVSRGIAARAAHAAPGCKLGFRPPWKAYRRHHCPSLRGSRGYASRAGASMDWTWGLTIVSRRSTSWRFQTTIGWAASRAAHGTASPLVRPSVHWPINILAPWPARDAISANPAEPVWLGHERCRGQRAQPVRSS